MSSLLPLILDFVWSETIAKAMFSTLACKVMKKRKIYFKNLVFTPQDFKSIFGYFSAFCLYGLSNIHSAIALHEIQKYLSIEELLKKLL